MDVGLLFNLLIKLKSGICFLFSTDCVVLPSLSSVKAGTPCNKDLLDIAGEFGASWKMFCRALHLTEATLAQIEENEHDMVSKCHGTVTENTFIS